jgi:DNA-binding transcriptional LysR family regulator
LVLVVPEHHAVADLPSMQLIDALEFDHVGLHEASALHAFLNRECEQLNKPLKVRIQVSSFESACRMIEAGVGVGVLPESAARRHARSMAIRLVPLSDAWALRSMQICVRSLDELPAFARDLIDLLAEDARQAMA